MRPSWLVTHTTTLAIRLATSIIRPLRSKIGDAPLTNLFDNLPDRAENESVEALLARPDVRIERIVSYGHTTPADSPYDQDHDEWVLLLRGSAGLWLDGAGERDLRPGDTVLIPAHCIHRVTRTAANEPTIWLAIHFCRPESP